MNLSPEPGLSLFDLKKPRPTVKKPGQAMGLARPGDLESRGFPLPGQAGLELPYSVSHVEGFGYWECGEGAWNLEEQGWH